MAEKKANNKKTTTKTKSKVVAKKAVPKKTEVKKTEVKKEVKKEVSKKAEKPVSERVKKESNDIYKSIAIGLGVLIVIMILLIGGFFLMKNNSTENVVEEQTQEQTQISSDSVTLLIVEDPNCTNCEVDLFASQVKENLINNLVVEKVSIATPEGKAILEKLNLNQVPAYLFSENINQRSDFKEQLEPAFVEVALDSINYYMLNPQFVPTKVLIEEPVILGGSVVYGNVNAPVTIYEFSDYECPFCGIAEGNEELVAQFSAQSPGYIPPMPKIWEEYIQTGKVKLVYYNMPLESLHPKVRPAHLAALCANEQGIEYWADFHHKLFAERSTWTESADYSQTMKDFAAELNLNTQLFNECLDSKKYNSQIEAELELGVSLGVSGTPAFFIGKTFLSGAQDYNTFKAIIEEQLAQN